MLPARLACGVCAGAFPAFSDCSGQVPAAARGQPCRPLHFHPAEATPFLRRSLVRWGRSAAEACGGLPESYVEFVHLPRADGAFQCRQLLLGRQEFGEGLILELILRTPRRRCGGCRILQTAPLGRWQAFVSGQASAILKPASRPVCRGMSWSRYTRTGQMAGHYSGPHFT